MPEAPGPAAATVPGSRVEVPTPLGPAAAYVEGPASGPARGLLVLGHGAGGSGWSADLLAVHAEARAAGYAVALVDQPWRLAGRRVAPAPARLDEGWLAVLAALRDDASTAQAAARRLLVGGRSAGARVACRTAVDVGAAAVLALAFPLHPPGRPERSRAPELGAAGVPVLVVQGARDPFGSPEEVRDAVLDLPATVDLEVREVTGTHSLPDREAVAGAVRPWLNRP